MYKHILVAVDATAESAGVLAHTAALAVSQDAAVRVLHIQAVDVVGGGTLGVVQAEPDDEARRIVTDAVETLRAAGVSNAEGWAGETLRSDVADTVVKHAREYGADLLVLGARRHQGLAAMFLGSVSDTVVHSAPCPVLLVPEAARAA
ncbi:universal stress protein [Yinghuangia sp. ASG 101]|uniref:universal stress protein n=1 Tax=Yinghuangia sp. ASG 101 TaxID=2896848 RepID=UPI001E4AE325|nr:universal stress protein [Yinghuangia sp. ASG 101]UGQ14420.1 universal stress protein [Yinghuangia sp. ASG 101]